jgi:hypothetical protein
MRRLLDAAEHEIDMANAKGGRAGARGRLLEVMCLGSGVPPVAPPLGWQVIYAGDAEASAVLSSVIYRDRAIAESMMKNGDTPKYLQPVFASTHQA